MKFFVFSFLSIVLFLGCNQDVHEKKSVKIVATTNLIAEALDYMAGDIADVQMLMGPGVDPHLYKASQGDLSLLTDADLIVYNGLHLEGKMAGLFEKLAKTREKNAVVALGDLVDHKRLIRLDDQNRIIDPHIWFDHTLWLQGLSGIIEIVKANLPEHVDSIDARWERYQMQVTLIVNRWKVLFDALPEQQKVLITSHDAFEYLGRSFGLSVYGLQSISTIGEYGIQDVTRLSDLIIEQKVKAVFTESSVNPKSIEALRENCRRRGHVVQMGGELYSDALGAKGTAEGTYAGMLQHNLSVIYKAIQ